jgi:hypothetical protein
MTKTNYISNHLVLCRASRAKKYDLKKSSLALHSVFYSRNKCAKNAYRLYLKKQNKV